MLIRWGGCPEEKMIQCGCGCGEWLEEFNKWGHKRNYILGHHNIGSKQSQEARDKLRGNTHNTFKPIETEEMCKFGCNQVAKFISRNGKLCCSEYHSSCPQQRKKKSKGIKKCYDEGRRPIMTEKQRKVMTEGRFKSGYYDDPLHKENMRQKALAAYENNPELKSLLSDISLELWKTDEYREKFKEYHEFLRNGGMAYVHTFIKNPSIPQVKLYKKVLAVSPYAVLNYPCIWTNRVIDVAIPTLAIAIEYDDPYWHQNKEEDVKREQQLEQYGWKFIRYIAFMPSFKEIVEDINRAQRSRHDRQDARAVHKGSQ